MGLNIASTLVFQADVRNPVTIRERVDIADFVGTPGRIPSPSARIWRDSSKHFHIERIEKREVAINGKSIPARPLRDGDEIVVGSTVVMFRQAPLLADLEANLSWDRMIVSGDVEFKSDVRRIFDTMLLNSGLPRDNLQEHVVEDWRLTPVLGPHFGFGRTRSLYLDPGMSFGIDQSRWDIVGSGEPTLMRHRLVSVGLPGAVIKWEVSRRSRDLGAPFVHDVLVVGWQDEMIRRTVQQAIRSRFGSSATFSSAEDTLLWSLHHTDRILGLPGRSGAAPDDGIYCTISRF